VANNPKKVMDAPFGSMLQTFSQLAYLPPGPSDSPFLRAGSRLTLAATSALTRGVDHWNAQEDMASRRKFMKMPKERFEARKKDLMEAVRQALQEFKDALKAKAIEKMSNLANQDFNHDTLNSTGKLEFHLINDDGNLAI